MRKAEIRGLIDRLMCEIEEEDIGISLFSTYCQGEDELAFFKKEDREHIVKIIKKLSDDSHRHKKILTGIIEHLGSHLGECRCHEN